MHRPFKLEVFKSLETTSFITRGFLLCVVTSTASRHSTRQFAYCLHCRLLRSVSWFNHHKRKVCFEPSPRSVALFHAKFDHYVRDIETEVELLHETGRLFFGSPQRLCDRSSVQTPQLLAIPDEVEEGLPRSKKASLNLKPTNYQFSAKTMHNPNPRAFNANDWSRRSVSVLKSVVLKRIHSI